MLTKDLSSFHAHNALKTTPWDSLEKALTVFILPPSTSDTRKRVHRRLDLIFADPKVYWTAVVGWSVLSQTRILWNYYESWLRCRTGSKMFERDLRLWAKEKKWVLPHLRSPGVPLIDKFSEASSLIVLECMSCLAYLKTYTWHNPWMK